MASSPIGSILKSVQEIGRELQEPVHVFGTTAPTRAFFLARWWAWAQENLSTSLPPESVVLCSDDATAEDLANDLEALSRAILGTSVNAIHFPTWEQSPYSSIVPSLRTRHQRISVLGRLIQKQKTPSIIVTTWAAACQATLPEKTLRDLSISLRVGTSIESLETLIRRLLDAGYLRVDPVEDPGSFAVRGEIVDIFPPGADLPYRIELFGEEIEKIRLFDPQSQRVITEKKEPDPQEIFITPAREVLVNPSTTPLIRERIKTYADDVGISRAIRDPILHSVSEGTYPQHSDAWAPFAYEKPENLWSYIKNPIVIWDDEMAVLQNWDSFQQEQNTLAEESKSTGLILPPVPSLFHSPKELEQSIRFATKVHLDRVEMVDTQKKEEEPLPEETGPPQETEKISSRHRIAVKTNSDLGLGSRHSLAELEPKFRLWLKQGFRVVILASTQSQLDRIRFLLEERQLPCKADGEPIPSIITLKNGSITEGFRWPAEGLVVLTESDILGTRHIPQRKRSGDRKSSAKEWSGLQALSDLSPGDAIVHVDHGIGRYNGLVRLDLQGAPSDFLQVEYANKDKLYIPIYRLNVVQKYVGSADSVTLDKLGSTQFAKAKEKVRDAVKKLAIDLVKLYAERKVRPGIQFSPRDGVFKEFEAQFPYDETPDQLKAIDDTLSDMESGKAMDRLICGDVGYGKTEVAIRAAFRAVTDGKQVAVLVPTTILAHQHEQSFKARLKDYPIKVESISRFKSAKEQKAVLEEAAQGKVDILIGTHRLLSRDIRFKDLGLVIVDEEHRFGVEHKEKLKTLKINTHVLTLTATPIPRTLHMSLSGLRDISLINTPPVDRLPIRTYVSKFDDSLIKRAIEMEINRGGQAFFVHNRVESIFNIANQLRDLIPSAKISVAHGQMPDTVLEEAMVNFYSKQSNLLVCTAIIESGLDLPSANTILVNHADRFGLAQLYQIRGRVGRGQNRAYAYLLIPAEGSITEDAKRRLEVIQRFVELGSGFSVASHDMEIRGGGDLLGPQQSGHIATVGFDLYTELLEEAIRELQGKPLEPEESRREPEIRVPFAAFLGDQYVPDVHQRLSLYRRFSAATQEQEIQSLEEELKDRFGPLPPEAQNLMWLIRLKQLLKRFGIDALAAGKEKLSLTPGKDSPLDPVRVISLVSTKPDQYQITPDSKLVVKIPTTTLSELYLSLESLLHGVQIVLASK